MLLRSRMRAAGECDLRERGALAVCDNTDDNRASECAMRGAVESCRMRVLPERDDDDLSRIPVRDRDTVAAAREDGEYGSDAGVRHERRRDTGVGSSVDERNAGKLQPCKSDDSDKCNVWSDVDIRIPGSVLWRTSKSNGDDDVHGRSQ